ncbi:MAG: copper chaperone PCu(A)C [Paracoccaceae bacterium]
MHLWFALASFPVGKGSTLPFDKREEGAFPKPLEISMNKLLTTVAALMFATTAYAQSFKSGELEIVNPFIPVPSAAAMSAAGYLQIENTGLDADKLIGVEADFAKMPMLHLSSVDANGVATMNHVEALDIPGQSTVALQRGGYHIMLMGLKMPLTAGASLPATLIFEQAGRVEIEFKVEPMGGDMDHSTMDHAQPAKPSN